MIYRTVLASLIVVTVLSAASCAMGAGAGVRTPVAPVYSGTARQEIRQMPLLERPNRPGHFIGNTIRSMYYGRGSRGS